MKSTKFVMQQPMNMIGVTMTEEEAKKLLDWIEDCSTYSTEGRESKKQILDALIEGLTKAEPELPIQAPEQEDLPEPSYEAVAIDENGIHF